MVRSVPVAPVEERSGVFVSYARADGETFARKLADDLGALGLDIWMDRLQMLGGRNWWQQIADAIGCAAVIVVVMTPEAVFSETVRREGDYARKEGVCVFPVKAHPDLDFSAMPTWMSDRHFYDLGHEWDAFISQLHGNCEAERVPFMAPELPEGYVERTELLTSAKRQLLAHGSGDAVAGTFALHGSGGYGKTTLALALCHDEDVMRAFSDGILWMTLGQSPDIGGELDKMHRALTGQSMGAVDEDEAFRLVVDRLEDRRCLIVIDDAWRSSDLGPFGRDLLARRRLRCSVLITTRRFDIIPASAGAEARLHVDEMTIREGVRMLTAGIGPSPPNWDPYEALVERLDAWPLLVRLSNGALRLRLARQATPEEALAYVNEALTRHNLTATPPTPMNGTKRRLSP